MLSGRFYPEALKNIKTKEFLELKHGSMFVQNYTNKFNKLAPYAKMIAPTELERTRRYEEGFSEELMACVVGNPATTFNEAYNRALHVTTTFLSSRAWSSSVPNSLKRPLVLFSSQGSRKKPNHGGQSVAQAPLAVKPTSFVPPSGGLKCFKCHKDPHPGTKYDGSPSICFNCKQHGHFFRQCPMPCKLLATTLGSTHKPSSKTVPRVGRVYVMTREEAEAHPEIIIGTCLIRVFYFYILSNIILLV